MLTCKNIIPGGFERQSKENLIDDYFDDELGDEFDDEAFEISCMSARNNNDSQKRSLFNEPNNNNIFNTKQPVIFDESHYILEDLKSSILNHNLARMTSLMEQNALDVDCLLKSSWTPLMYAVSIGALPIVQYLLEKSANVTYSQGFRRKKR